MAALDDLTGLKNRRAFNNEYETVSHNFKTIALLVIDIDIDNFKYYNDTYGHLCGDDILIKIGKTLHAFESQYASVYRIGGEEFALFYTIIPKMKVLYLHHGNSSLN